MSVMGRSNPINKILRGEMPVVELLIDESYIPLIEDIDCMLQELGEMI